MLQLADDKRLGSCVRYNCWVDSREDSTRLYHETLGIWVNITPKMTIHWESLLTNHSDYHWNACIGFCVISLNYWGLEHQKIAGLAMFDKRWLVDQKHVVRRAASGQELSRYSLHSPWPFFYVTFPVRKVLKQLEDKILKLLSESSGTWIAHVAPMGAGPLPGQWITEGWACQTQPFWWSFPDARQHSGWSGGFGLKIARFWGCQIGLRSNHSMPYVLSKCGGGDCGTSIQILQSFHNDSSHVCWWPFPFIKCHPICHGPNHNGFWFNSHLLLHCPIFQWFTHHSAYIIVHPHLWSPKSSRTSFNHLQSQIIISYTPRKCDKNIKFPRKIGTIVNFPIRSHNYNY